MEIQKTSNGRNKAIRRIEAAMPDIVREHIAGNGPPVIFASLIRDWKAAREWSLDSLKSRFGSVVVEVYLHLPIQGAPYEQKLSAHRRSMTFGDFIDSVQCSAPDQPSYMPEKPIELFPDAARDLAFGSFALANDYPTYTRLWIGSAGTRSGLHFDRYDNLLSQVFGSKKAFLAAPDQIRRLYPFIDYIQKSQVDPENPDLDRFPEYPNAEMMTGILNPGDVLFIPKLWWHHLRSLDKSVSANYWYGQSASLGDQLKPVLACPTRYWLRTVWDFCRLGLLNRPYELRLFSEAPTGKYFYDQTLGFRFPRKPSA
jgi:hypothetical protein